MQIARVDTLESVAICYLKTTIHAGGFPNDGPRMIGRDDVEGDPSGPTGADAIRVNDRLAIPRSEIVARASRAGGPGGQHVNTSSTRIELTWNVTSSTALTPAQRARLLDKLARRIDSSGQVRVVCSEMRSQRQNRDRAERRLAELIAAALVVPRRRKPTKPSRAARQARLDAKKQQSRKKSDRRKAGDE